MEIEVIESSYRDWNRRRFIKLAVLLPVSASLAHFRLLAQTQAKKIKITGISAMALNNIAGNCLIRVDTDSGLTGYGEAGATGPMARARIETIKPLLLGKDPLEIEVHFQQMSSMMYNYVAHIPTVSGIDIALWDLAGKILGRSVSELLGGGFREEIAMYSHGIGVDLLDKPSCRAWAQRIRSMPEGFTVFKCDAHNVVRLPSGIYANTLTSSQLRDMRTAYENAREAVGDDIDIAVHCHGEFDIRRSNNLTLLTGEKLELVRGFRPFLDNQVVDIIHPDLAFAGGITGTKKIADFAALSRTPVALHNVGSLVLTYANAHFAASIQNFYKSESALGREGHHLEGMAAMNPPLVRGGKLKVPNGPGLGLDLSEDFLRKNMMPSETYWS